MSATTAGLPWAEVVGDPIAHSLSPIIHGFWLEALGIEGDYRRTLVKAGGLKAHVAERRADPDWRGCNVTMPLKREAIDLGEALSDRAVAAGAANILLVKDGRLHAANTDVGAIAALVARCAERGFDTSAITLLGNGGAARAALVAFRLLGISEVIIQARDMADAVRLAVEFNLGQAPRPLTDAIVTPGLINATPLGMTERECLNCDLKRMPARGWVYDMVTDPVETPLIAAAKRQELGIVTGREMLVEQAAASFRLLFGADPPRDRDAALLARLDAA